MLAGRNARADMAAPLQHSAAEVRVMQCDVTAAAEAAGLLHCTRSARAQIATILHTGGVLRDAMLPGIVASNIFLPFLILGQSTV